MRRIVIQQPDITPLPVSAIGTPRPDLSRKRGVAAGSCQTVRAI